MTPKLAVIVGHSQKQPGSRAGRPIDKMEYDWNLDFAMDLYIEAKSQGLDCQVYKRDGLSIQKVGELVSDWCKPDGVAIELHCNSFDGKITGTETLYDDVPATSKEFAELVHKKIVGVFGTYHRMDRGIKHRSTKDLDASNDRGAINLESVKVTSCLVEPVFWDNPREAKLLADKRGEYLRALVSAVANWY